MKKTTNTKKKSVKAVATFVPVYTIDYTKCETVEDVIEAFAIAKTFHYLSENEVEALVISILDCGNELAMSKAKVFDISNGEEFVISSRGVEIKKPKAKKPNIFKRFWNWITRK